MTLDYADVVRGSKDAWTVVLTDATGWPAGSDSWTWKMLIAGRATPETLKLGITSTSSVITTVTDSDDTMTLVFDLTATNSDTLTAGLYLVEIEGAEGGGTEHYYDPAAGTFHVRDPYAGG